MSKIILPAVVAPVVAALAAGLATYFLYTMIKRADREPVAGWFRHAQSVSASLVALAHGTSDGQKTMGVITLVLITAGYQESGTGPQFWVIASAGLAIGLGTYSGGWRIMRTMGKGIVDVKAPQGFAAETTSAAAILASSHMGFGLSTTQVCSGSILGSGIGKKLAQVRWSRRGRSSTGGCSPCRPPRSSEGWPPPSPSPGPWGSSSSSSRYWPVPVRSTRSPSAHRCRAAT